jgi:hypothetical protein
VWVKIDEGQRFIDAYSRIIPSGFAGVTQPPFQLFLCDRRGAQNVADVCFTYIPFCSQGSRGARGGAKPWMEGTHAVYRWISRERQVHAAVHLSQTARLLDARKHARAELPVVEAGVRLMCAACGNRGVTVVFEPPTNREVRNG